MDPFDEFEIKPLSDGLGFHKKTVSLSEQFKNSGVVENQMSRIPSYTEKNEGATISRNTGSNESFAELLKVLQPSAKNSDLAGKSQKTNEREPAKNIRISETLPQPGSMKRKAASTQFDFPVPGSMPHYPDVNKNYQPESSLNKVVESVGLKRGAADSPVRMLEKASVAISASILDGIVIFALSLVFLVVLMTVTKIDLSQLIVHSGLDLPTQLAFTVLMAAVLLMYVVVTRSFFGRTLGEWTFDFQMGDDLQHKMTLYPLRVLWRGILVLMTGIVLLPLLSLLFRQDLLASITGLQLYRQK